MDLPFSPSLSFPPLLLCFCSPQNLAKPLLQWLPISKKKTGEVACYNSSVFVVVVIKHKIRSSGWLVWAQFSVVFLSLHSSLSLSLYIYIYLEFYLEFHLEFWIKWSCLHTSPCTCWLWQHLTAAILLTLHCALHAILKPYQKNHPLQGHFQTHRTKEGGSTLEKPVSSPYYES